MYLFFILIILAIIFFIITVRVSNSDLPFFVYIITWLLSVILFLSILIPSVLLINKVNYTSRMSENKRTLTNELLMAREFGSELQYHDALKAAKDFNNCLSQSKEQSKHWFWSQYIPKDIQIIQPIDLNNQQLTISD